VLGLAGTVAVSPLVGVLVLSAPGASSRLIAEGAPATSLTSTRTGPVTGPLGTAPRANPAQNIAPSPNFLQDCSGSYYDDSQGCVSATLQAIANARSQEGLPGMALPSNWTSLNPEQQLFVATNLERTVRGLPALSAMASVLDAAAALGAQTNADPSPPAGFPWTIWGSNWAAAVGNPLEAIYYWMYDDGEGSSNIDCTPSNTSGCWGHRDNVLIGLACQPCEMGTGYAPGAWQGEPGWAELLVDTSGDPGVDFTWNQVVPYLPNGNGIGLPDPDLFEYISDHVGGRVWNAYDQTAASGGPGITATPSAVVDPADSLTHVLVRAADGHLVEFVDDGIGGHTWNAYDLTAAYGALDIAGSPTAIFDPSDHHLHVFERASDGHLLEYADDGAGGNAWNVYDLTAAYAGGMPLGADPSAIYDSAQGLVHVYAQSTAGHMVEYTNDGANGQPWNAYDLSIYAGSGGPVSGTPSAVYDASQDLVHTYVEGSNGHLVEYLSDHSNGHVWNAYDLSVYAGGGTPVAGSPGAVYDSGQGLIHTYVEGANGSLYEYVSDHSNGRVWNAYDLSSGAGGGGAISGTPDPVYDPAQDLIHTYVDGSNGHLVEYLSDHANGHVWNAYDLSADSGGGSAVGGGASAVVVGQTIHVYVGGE